MDLSFLYGWVVAIFGLLGANVSDAALPQWLQNSVEFIRKQSREQTESAAQAHFGAYVSAVSDGDSIRVIDPNGQRRRIRFAYVDAPELNQAYGKAARKALMEIIEGQNVEVLVFDRDRYGREVAQVRLNGRDVGLWMIANGHAWHYRQYAKRAQNGVDYSDYTYAQAQARQNRIGLWRAARPQAPWDFRAMIREQQSNTGK
ncbi:MULTISPECIES: thermonuclease family protein [Neisseria]|uniref:thermonuclease family protein n=1 Tax=Neisseria TaxID=482 RepID=UPI00069C41D3|nr:thermonuclease family protein [Neisseria arctica]UOO87222.1 thermonuclease family protein [Neisseria arctica]